MYRLVGAATWFLAGLVAGYAGFVLAESVGTFNPYFGFSFFLITLTAAVAGGLGKPFSTMAGALIVGIALEFTGAYFSCELRTRLCLCDPGHDHSGAPTRPLHQRQEDRLRMIQYLISILTEGAIFGIMALGLNVIWGWSGDFDLAYYGYVALGAYMTLVLTIGQPTPPAEYILGLQLPYLVALLGAVVSSALMGLVVGLIALRHLRGIYFSIVTLGAVYVLYVLAGQYVPLFDGYNGLSGLFNPMGDALGLDFQSYPVLLPRLLRVHIHPRLYLHGASLRKPVWSRATIPS